MQYTIRNIPEALDAALRERARTERKSLNEVAVAAMVTGMGLAGLPVRHRDLTDLAGSWQQDSAFDRAMTEQDLVDSELWE